MYGKMLHHLRLFTEVQCITFSYREKLRTIQKYQVNYLFLTGTGKNHTKVLVCKVDEFSSDVRNSSATSNYQHLLEINRQYRKTSLEKIIRLIPFA